MENIKRVGVILDAPTHKKTREFAVLNNVSQSEIIRVLIEKAPLKIDVRKIGSIILDAKKKGKINKYTIKLLLPEKLDLKLKKMSLTNDTSFSEIVRQLITNTDLNNLTYKTRGENILAAKAKKVNN